MRESHIKTAVIQHHHFMYHRQFQMRFRVINWQTAIFNNGNLNEQINENKRRLI